MANQDGNDKMNMIMEVLSDCNHEKVARTVNSLRDNNPGLSRKELAQKFINGSALKNGLKGGLASAGATLALPLAVGVLGGDLVRSLRAQTFLLHCIAQIYDQDPRDAITRIHDMVLTSSDSWEEVIKEINDIFTDEFLLELSIGCIIRSAAGTAFHYQKNAASQSFKTRTAEIAANFAVNVLGRKMADFTMKGFQKHLAKIFWNVGGKKFAARATQRVFSRAIPIVGAVAGFGLDWHSLQKKGKLAIEYYEAGLPVLIKSLATSHPANLTLVSEGLETQKSVIYIRGVWTGHERDDDVWEQRIRAAGWRGNIYRFWWDSSDIKDLFSPSISTIPDALKAVGKLLHWRKHRQNAKLIGSGFLPQLVADSDL